MNTSEELELLMRQIRMLHDKIDVLLTRLNEQANNIEEINNKVNPKKPKKATLNERVKYSVEKSIAKYITK